MQSFRHILNFCVSFLVCATLANAVPAPKPTGKVEKGNPRSIELNEKGVQAIQRKDFVFAEDLFRQAVAADPRNIAATYNLAGVYITNKKEEAAIHLLEETIKNVSGDAGLYARLGDAYFSNQRSKDAAVNYERALKINPEYPKLALKLGTIYSMQNRLNDAERMMLQAVKEDQKDWQALSNLSSIYVANNKPTEAVRAAKQSLQLKASSDAYVALGQAYEMLKDAPNAKISYEKALALGGEAKSLKTRIESLEKVG